MASGRHPEETRVLVEYRNDVIHGAGVPSVGIGAATAQIASWLDYFFLVAVSGTPVELLVAGTMTSSRGSFRVEWARLAGRRVCSRNGSPPNSGRRPRAGKPTCAWASITSTPGPTS